MTPSVGRRVMAGVMAAGSACAVAGLISLAPNTAASAAPAPRFTLAFENLTPGAPQSRTGTFSLERDATLTGFAWLERAGVMADAALDVRVCDSAGTCADPASAADVAFDRGVIAVSVTAEIAEDTSPALTGSVIGRLTFVADDADSGLAGTGVDVAVWLSVTAAVLAAGSLLVALGRRPVTRRRGPTS